MTVNPCLDVDQYPLPKPDDLFATLANGKTFSKLDLSHVLLVNSIVSLSLFE